MALVKLVKINDNSFWALWKIGEPLQELSEQYPPLLDELACLSEIHHPNKKAEWLAGRLTVKMLIEQFGQPFQGVFKDEHGKPYLSNSSFHISLANSYPYAAAIIHRDIAVGIDLEPPKSTLLRIRHKFLNEEELTDAGLDLHKLCIYWCAKECLYKIHGKRELSFRQNMHIENFDLSNRGIIQAHIRKMGMITDFQLYYDSFPGYFFVYGF